MKRLVFALIAAGCALPATAQVLTGQYVRAPGRQDGIQTEFNCRHAIPLDPESAEASTERVQKAMAAYLALTPNATQRDLYAVFVVDDPGTPWQDGDQKVKLDELAKHLSPPTQPPKLTTIVMGGDNQTSRTIWSGQDAAGPIFYAVDFTNGTSMSRAHILDMAISHGSVSPETPPAYCHMSARFVSD